MLNYVYAKFIMN